MRSKEEIGLPGRGVVNLKVIIFQEEYLQDSQ
jgi:hypothetical protein